ncbi:acyltransferase family protein [Acidomonas methanolica]|uniref:acyltransferase family protein n=1 Tax=Acidomonas methanolica TaxID=437 RepID=UPI002119E1E3|nr:acyltransferase [Acidomonas methanolica]MCQ9157213.1 acyltransferase [Acidomonas methanolica]
MGIELRKLENNPANLPVSQQRRRIPQLTGLKGIAIIVVVIWHGGLRGIRRLNVMFPEHNGEISFYKWLPHGEIAVDLFFLISGIVILLPFVGKSFSEWNLSSFYQRRFWRIYPPYLIAMIICAAGLWHTIPAPISKLLISAFYVNGIINDAPSPFNPPAWSLEAEIQFYIIFPVVFYFYFIIKNNKARLTSGVVFFILISILAAFIHLRYNFDGRFRYALLAHFLFFGWGGVLADVLCCFKWRSSVAWDCLFFLSLIATYLVGIWLTSVDANPPGFGVWFATLLVSGITSVALVVGGIQGKFARRILCYPPICQVGVMTYSIYLVHVPVLEALSRLFLVHIHTHNSVLFWLLWVIPAILAVAGVSSVFYYFVEKPFAKRASIIKRSSEIKVTSEPTPSVPSF